MEQEMRENGLNGDGFNDINPDNFNDGNFTV